MIDEEITTEQLRSAGIEALERELGVVGRTRFLQVFETGYGDYTKDRHEWQDQMTVEEIYARIQAKREKPE